MLKKVIAPAALMLLAGILVAGCEQPMSESGSNSSAERSEDADSMKAMTKDESVDKSNRSDAKSASNDNNNSGSDNAMMSVCNLQEIGGSGVTGMIRFTQDGDSVKIQGEVKGLEPGLHGFHVHAEGDLSDKETGKSAGGHFNPTDQPHGKPSDSERHVGDLGNIEANEDGVAKVDMTDDVISLTGEHSIVGKSLMIHAGEDKFTQPTGDAGARVAFGLIEKSSSQNSK